MILNVDREKEKIALGLKQKSPSPWDHIEAKYPVGTKVKGEVVNIMPYGAFVKLEEGIEGLVAHQRDVLDPAHQPPVRGRHRRRPGRGRRPGDRQGQAGNLPRHEADRGQPLDAGEGEVPARHGQSRARSAT